VSNQRRTRRGLGLALAGGGLKLISSRISEERVRKWTGGDEKTGKQAGKEGKRDGEKISANGLKTPQPKSKFLAMLYSQYFT